MKSKKFLSLLVVPVLTGLLASCGDTSVSTSSSNSSSSASQSSTTVTVPDEYLIKEDTTIYMWDTFNDEYGKVIDNAVEQFKAIEPKVTVQHVKQTGSYNDLKAMVVTGFTADNYPDLVVAYPDHVAEYINYDKTFDLTPYMEDPVYGWSAEDFADLVPAYLDEGVHYSVPGTYSLPLAKSTEAMFYNEDVLLNSTVSAALAAQPTHPNGGNPITASYLNNLTWEELFNKLCPAIASYDATLPTADKILKTDQAYHSIFGYDSDDNLFITLAQQYDYDYTSVNLQTGKGSADFVNDGMKGLASTFHQAAANGYILSKGSAGNNYTNTYFTLQNLLFSVGSTGGYVYQFADTNPMNVGVAKIPHAEGKDPWVINQGPSLSFLNHGSENRRLASWLFYKLLTNEENSLEWCLKTGYNGIRNSNYESDEYIEQADVSETDPKTKARLKAKVMTYVPTVGDELFVSPAFVGSSACRTAVSGLMTKILTPDNDIAQVNTWFDDALTEAQKAIK
jgi:multiple sugar transport system substrate-binding protein